MLTHLIGVYLKFFVRISYFPKILSNECALNNKSCQLFNIQMAPLHLEELNQPIHIIQLGLCAPGHLQLHCLWVLLTVLTNFLGQYKGA